MEYRTGPKISDKKSHAHTLIHGYYGQGLGNSGTNNTVIRRLWFMKVEAVFKI